MRVEPRKVRKGSKRVTTGWNFKIGRKIFGIFKTQAAATRHATAKAKRLPYKAELVVKGRNGQVRMRNSYGHDPSRTKG